MLKLFLLQILIFLGCSSLLHILKVIFGKLMLIKPRVIDAAPIMTLFFIHFLTKTERGYSLVPGLIIVWTLIGLGLLINRAFFQLRLDHRTFYLTFWRIGDLFWLLAWLIVGGIVSI